MADFSRTNKLRCSFEMILAYLIHPAHWPSSLWFFPLCSNRCPLMPFRDVSILCIVMIMYANHTQLTAGSMHCTQTPSSIVQWGSRVFIEHVQLVEELWRFLILFIFHRLSKCQVAFSPFVPWLLMNNSGVSFLCEGSPESRDCAICISLPAREGWAGNRSL